LADGLSGTHIIVVGATGDTTGGSHPADPTGDAAEVLPEDVAMIAFTSGSTSRPKGVELTHRSMTCGVMNALLGGALAATRPAELRQNTKPLPPTSFVAGPFSHVSGYGTLLLSMYVGGKAVTLERWDPRRAVGLMLAQRATSLIGATAEMLRELLRHEGVAGLGEFVRTVVAQGTALPQSLLRELKSTLSSVSIGAGYGLTETNGSVCMGSEAMLSERPDTSGRPLPTVDLKIRREDGEEAAPGEVGEVVLRGAMLMRGYANQPEETGRVLQDGWLRTGDLGWLDGDGFLYLADRANRFVICGDTKVSCSAVERVVLDNKLADEAFAFGSEEMDRKEELVLVVSRLGERDPDDADIVAALRKTIHASMSPRIVRLESSFPKTPSGKIDGRELRRRTFAQGGGG
jgi:acyl-CoA synthetase (AMP-forming)/AMP-acid ligase II